MSRDLIWALIAALVGAAEAVGIFTQAWPTLTEVVVRRFPEEVTFTVICWLFVHFAVRYRRRAG